ncbi:NADH-quinone oxidoreductase subunit C [Anaerolinea thermophila]|uniref:NADH-quinone oxidoreductase subunit C n=1 Tax=Anaerolinea thermophila (strain DSM 14523 / JCM 11388 / NBRC 100420 / UNI-1) TaxID=926569 RepID=E8N2Q9_ANATU|nr:NADH-quinone oxidoreductase subunit C [Anaerolinea thermophila]BAJ62865.1 NADH-quinone oxidoreductase chain C [Anaerolinea thermophila UNI-1]
MDEKMRTVVEGLQSRFNLEVQEFRGEVTLIVPPEQIVAVAQTLRDEHGFEQLVDVTAVDYFPQQEPRFHVVYHIRSLAQTLIICLRVPLNGNFPSVSTVEKVYPGANWYEREVYDMFGITFEGHSDLRRILMPYDWQGHPLRKDYPLGYEEVQFSFNIDEVLKRKLRPRE